MVYENKDRKWLDVCQLQLFLKMTLYVVGMGLSQKSLEIVVKNLIVIHVLLYVHVCMHGYLASIFGASFCPLWSAVVALLYSYNFHQYNSYKMQSISTAYVKSLSMYVVQCVYIPW